MNYWNMCFHNFRFNKMPSDLFSKRGPTETFLQKVLVYLAKRRVVFLMVTRKCMKIVETTYTATPLNFDESDRIAKECVHLFSFKILITQPLFSPNGQFGIRFLQKPPIKMYSPNQPWGESYLINCRPSNCFILKSSFCNWNLITVIHGFLQHTHSLSHKYYM